MTDYKMAGMRGDELVTRIRQMAPSQPILMVTGSAEQEGAAAFQAVAVLRKPFFLNDLRQALRHVMSPVPA
jgi:CheY-like chemotaxis protein